MSRFSRESLFRRLTWSDLDPLALAHLIDLACREDLEGWGLLHSPSRHGDVTTAILGLTIQGRAALISRGALTVCGLPLIPMILQRYGSCSFEPRVREGAFVPAKTILGVFEGPLATLLPAERVILNFVQRLSGIATTTHHYVKALHSDHTRLLDTRKTTPGYRMLEKVATATGGGWNHRLGLFDRVMFKDNHLAAKRSANFKELAQAVRSAKLSYPELPVEVELDSLEPLDAVLEAGADIVLFDNFNDQTLKEAITRTAGRAITEASGNITLTRLPALANLGLDCISTGATVHQSAWVDLGLDWMD